MKFESVKRFFGKKDLEKDIEEPVDEHLEDEHPEDELYRNVCKEIEALKSAPRSSNSLKTLGRAKRIGELLKRKEELESGYKKRQEIKKIKAEDPDRFFEGIYDPSEKSIYKINYPPERRRIISSAVDNYPYRDSWQAYAEDSKALMYILDKLVPESVYKIFNSQLEELSVPPEVRERFYQSLIDLQTVKKNMSSRLTEEIRNNKKDNLKEILKATEESQKFINLAVKHFGPQF